VKWAGVLNTATVAEKAAADERYHAGKNRRVPKRIDSRLVLFDCLTCDKCVPVCPNDANFTYPLAARDFVYSDLVIAADGTVMPGESKSFRVAKKHQIGNYAEFCNECGNCDTFCPEYGGPYIEKPSFYRTAESLREAAPRDGFVVTRTETGTEILGRMAGTEHRAVRDARTGQVTYNDGSAEVVLAGETFEVVRATPLAGMKPGHVVDMGVCHALIGLMEGVLDESAVNQINAQWMQPA
jgi:putative selenate reductase